ncbi:MAG: GPW/gp25 family protein [Clostridiales bacterium]|nr:GPW/gp25 family protein [Clostridiales bacterium]MCD7887436.1 GPW/gp25 family protein [Clostridiales bacterium]
MDGKEFLGRGLKFPLQVDARTGKLAMVSEEEDIQESIGILLRTSRGERVMRPEFGTSTMEYAFAPISSSMIQSISYDISRQLTNQEPRITNVTVTCQQADPHTGTVIVEVSYTVRNTNNRYNHVYPFYLTEGSEGGGAK